MAIECPTCKCLNQDTARFCSNCGLRLREGQVLRTQATPGPGTLPEETPKPPFKSGKPDTLPEIRAQAASELPSPVGKGWQPSGISKAHPAPPSDSLNTLLKGAIHTVTTAKVNTLEGVVRGLRERQETHGKNAPWTVWSFRLESFDESGDREQVVPVEMRGRSFQGAINEGDKLRIKAERPKGQTLRVSELYNITTRSEVKVKAKQSMMWVWNLVWILIFVVIPLFFIISLFE